MGVPKLFKFLNCRYPDFTRKYNPTAYNMHCLYMDVSQIIHFCSQPDCYKVNKIKSEKIVVQQSLAYIEDLVNIVCPSESVFVSMDGEAPDAKTSVRRARNTSSMRRGGIGRNRMASGMEDLISHDMKVNVHDIRPGTAFMEYFESELLKFIQSKKETEWRNLRVICNGHKNPGEGEHKIQDFIRYCRSSPEYNPNAVHCFYGLDADLILLGLALHEPNVFILREETRFERDQYFSPATERPFSISAISLLRCYIEQEFQCLKTSLGSQYNVETLIDDWVFLISLCGNDFISAVPHVTDLYQDLPKLFQAYRESRPTMMNYISPNGFIDLHSLVQFAKTIRNYEIKFVKKELAGGNCPPETTEAEDSQLLHEFKQKRCQLVNGMPATREYVQMVSEGYVRTLQWVGFYYYAGVPSWSWYYPVRTAPFLSDLALSETPGMEASLVFSQDELEQVGGDKIVLFEGAERHELGAEVFQVEFSAIPMGLLPGAMPISGSMTVQPINRRVRRVSGVDGFRSPMRRVRNSSNNLSSLNEVRNHHDFNQRRH